MNTFPELSQSLDNNLRSIVEDDNNVEESVAFVKETCKKVYPERFFDILYKNDKIFEQEEQLMLLPGIDFRVIWMDNISDNTRETIWKYLQLILFSVVSDLSDSSSFGSTAKLFEAIDDDKFKEKLEETIKQLQETFDTQGETSSSHGTGLNNDNFPNPEKLHEHVSGMMEGKLGSLAREIAEETANEMNVDMENESSVGDIFQKFLQEPNKLMQLVQKVGGKLDDKIKQGDLKESELLAEAGEIMDKMKNIPGMEQFQSMFGGQSNAKMNIPAMQAKMKQNMKSAKQREKMKETLLNKNNEDKESVMTDEQMEQATMEANDAVMSLLRSEGVNEEGIEKMIFSTGEVYQQSSSRQEITTPDDSKKKKRKKRKKGKGGK